MVFAGGMLAAIAFIINSGTYSAEDDRYMPFGGDRDYLSDFLPFACIGAALSGYANRTYIMNVKAMEVATGELMFPLLTCALLLALYAGSMLSKLTKY
jgi:hypothetical protein